jgi:hypothetical protein
MLMKIKLWENEILFSILSYIIIIIIIITSWIGESVPTSSTVVSYRVHKYKNICNCKKKNTYSTTYRLWSRKSKYRKRVSTNPRKSRTYCMLFEAVPSLRCVVDGLSLLRPGFTPGSVHVGFVVDKVALPQVFLRVTWSSPVSIIPPWLSILILLFGWWRVGSFVAAVQRHSLTPSTWTSKNICLYSSVHIITLK